MGLKWSGLRGEAKWQPHLPWQGQGQLKGLLQLTFLGVGWQAASPCTSFFSSFESGFSLGSSTGNCTVLWATHIWKTEGSECLSARILALPHGLPLSVGLDLPCWLRDGVRGLTPLAVLVCHSVVDPELVQ